MKIKGEMLDLAKHIIETKHGTFDPSEYKDRYEAALAELVKAKLEGKPIPQEEPAKTEKVVDLMAGTAGKRGLRQESRPQRRRKPQTQGGASTAEGELIDGCA